MGEHEVVVPWQRRARKFLVAAAGGLAQVLAAGLLPESWRPWAAVLLAVATAAGVYRVPNAA